MLADHKVVALWQKLSNEFNVHVRSIGVGKDPAGDEITVVAVDDKTDPAVIATLPDKWANERVQYVTAAQAVAGPAKIPCGQTGHQCQCGSKAPNP
jgi:hypothetical protein